MSQIKSIPTRNSYGEALLNLGKLHDDIVVLDADLSSATRTSIFKKEFPERFLNCGIAENNMVCVSAGLALTGKVPFVSSFAMFLIGRSFEQIRNSIAYPNLNVKLVATHAGITVGEDGATHQCNEDIALMRSIPNMTIVNPCDHYETIGAINAAYNTKGPFYIRLGRAPVPVINKDNYKFELGKAIEMKKGTDVTIIATGIMVEKAIRAAEQLEIINISASVLNIHTIKPIDKDAIVNAAKNTKLILTAEEHNIIGGLFSAVSEVTSQYFNVRVLPLGIEDTFGMSGIAKELLDLFNLNEKSIVEKVKELVITK